MTTPAQLSSAEDLLEPYGIEVKKVFNDGTTVIHTVSNDRNSNIANLDDIGINRFIAMTGVIDEPKFDEIKTAIATVASTLDAGAGRADTLPEVLGN